MNKKLSIIIVLGALCVWFGADYLTSSDDDTQVSASGVISPSISSNIPLNSSWYCPVGSSITNGYADHRVMITNFGDVTSTADVRVLSEEGEKIALTKTIAPGATQVIRVADEIPGLEYAAVALEITNGNSAVSHSVTTTQGVADGPCATQASSTWYLAGGKTTSESQEYIALMNPFPELATVDIELQDSFTLRPDEQLRGITVKGNSIVLKQLPQKSQLLSAEITSKQGRIVAERLQIVNESLGSKGASLQLAVSEPKRSWMFTAGRVTSQGDHALIIYNPEPVERRSSLKYQEPDLAGTLVATSSPTEDDAEIEAVVEPSELLDPVTNIRQLLGDQTTPLFEPIGETAEIEIEIWPNDATLRDTNSVVPILRTIEAGKNTVVDLDTEMKRFGFDLPTDFSVQVTSKEIPVVAERWQFAEKNFDADRLISEDDNEPAEDDAPAEDEVEEPDFSEDLRGLEQPSASSGLATSSGSSLPVNDWLVPWVSVPGTNATVIAIYGFPTNDEASGQQVPIEVTVLANGNPTKLRNGEIPMTVPGRLLIPIPDTPVTGCGPSCLPGVALQVSSPEAKVTVEVQRVNDSSLDVIPAIPVIAQ